jgi:hypothetical protein
VTLSIAPRVSWNHSHPTNTVHTLSRVTILVKTDGDAGCAPCILHADLDRSRIDRPCEVFYDTLTMGTNSPHDNDPNDGRQTDVAARAEYRPDAGEADFSNGGYRNVVQIIF